ncbi:MAG: hypothetical protein M0R03_08890 [Novosphingobium sp.]|nr:hypothetical protein [Novosphingobium sp.]
MEKVKLGTKFKLETSIEGGKWKSSNNTMATITHDGYVDTLKTGSVTFTYEYTDENGCNAVYKYQITITCEVTKWEETMIFDVPVETLTTTIVEIPVSAIVTIPTEQQNPTTGESEIVDVDTEVNWSYTQERYKIDIGFTKQEHKIIQRTCCNASETITTDYPITYKSYIDNGAIMDGDEFITQYTDINLSRPKYHYTYEMAYWDNSVTPPVIRKEQNTVALEYEKTIYTMEINENKIETYPITETICS